MTPLETIIRARIATSGPITIADYMELCLSHPEHGYYMHRDPFGEAGDFTTAPEVSQMFGELIGAWTAALWQMTGGGSVAIVELGPGRGSLMRDFLRATAHVKGFHDEAMIVMVETSPQLTRLQRALLHEVRNVRWASDLSSLPASKTFFIANEFFDALPIRQFVKTAEGLKEKLVDLDPEKNALCYSLKEIGLRLVKGGRYAGDEAVVESSPASRALAQQMAHHVAQHGGGGLVIDYGYTGGSRGNTLQAVKRHLFHDPLVEPGNADLTAHVDFDGLAEVFGQSGMRVHGPRGQGEFLKAIGAEMRLKHLLERASERQKQDLSLGLRRLIHPSEMGELFKAVAFTRDAVTPPGFG